MNLVYFTLLLSDTEGILRIHSDLEQLRQDSGGWRSAMTTGPGGEAAGTTGGEAAAALPGNRTWDPRSELEGEEREFLAVEVTGWTKC